MQKISNHTNNQWITANDINMRSEISNATYKMTVDLYEDTKYNHQTKKFEPVAWYVTWWVATNSPLSDLNKQIDGQMRKRFTEKDKALKYIEGRKKTYVKYFIEEYPAIHKNYANCFKINGILLPNYRIESEEE